MKVLNLNQSVYQATQQYPELIPIIAGWGFPQIRNAHLRRTIGRRYTLAQAIRGLNLDKRRIIEKLSQNGFRVVE